MINTFAPEKDSLRETGTSKTIFLTVKAMPCEQTAKATRQTSIGKGCFCRVPFVGHTAKSMRCARCDPRQTKYKK